MATFFLSGSRNALLFVLIAILAQGATAGENDRRKLKVVGFTNSTLPPGTLADVNITNVGAAKGRCSDATAEFSIWGTLSEPRRASFSSTPWPEKSDIRLLHRREISLAPGQVERIAFSQPSDAKESIYFVTKTTPRLQKCFIQSPVAVSVSIDGCLTFVPGSTAAGIAEIDFVEVGGGDGGGSDPVQCCACVPVCACGYCN